PVIPTWFFLSSEKSISRNFVPVKNLMVFISSELMGSF
ncbi:MAG: hypothetical protein V7606_3538, partial [Burkholderiales bacterium]